MKATGAVPLGATRLASGDVVVQATRRADGSMRKPIRIRQGYAPPDEVAKYKTPAQRAREREAAKQSAAQDDAEGLAAQLEQLSVKERERKRPTNATPDAAAKTEARRDEGRDLKQPPQIDAAVQREEEGVSKAAGTHTLAIAQVRKRAEEDEKKEAPAQERKPKAKARAKARAKANPKEQATARTTLRVIEL